VKPILDELQYDFQPCFDRLPRVWWIGTGLASSFPFHAAGDSSIGPTESAYYRTISSYTPSIKALTYARERSATTSPSNSNLRKLLIVAMASTPGANSLPGVKREMSVVVEALGHSVSAEILEQPDVASVMRDPTMQHCPLRLPRRIRLKRSFRKRTVTPVGHC
jgi:hypothetical protein